VSNAALQLVRRYLGQLARVPGEQGDAEILRRYVQNKDPVAFEWLVRRHGPMVLGVCRRVLGLKPDVDDAFQATFLALALQAKSIRDTDRVAAWLHRVAYRTARKARARASPATFGEAPPLPTKDDPAAQAAWAELWQVLDEELNHLPERLGAPLVLCYLDGATQDEAARRLGWSLSTLKRRLEQGRELLRRRLTARGVAPVGLAAAALLPGGLRAAVPAKLSQAAGALGASFGTGAAVSPALLALVQQGAGPVSRLLLMSLLAALVVGGGVAAGILSLGRSGEPARPDEPPSAALNRPVPEPEPDAPPGGVASREPDISRVVDHLVGALKQRPPRRSTAPDLGLFLAGVAEGEVTLITDEPNRGLTYCGSPSWSADGRRILFDATPGQTWNRTRIQMIEVTEGRATLTDLGPGNCPALSPDGKRIAFLLHAGVVPDAQPGVWIMNTDGSERRRLGGYGIPKWSPDGRQILVVSFASPCQLTLLDAETGREQALQVPGHKVYPVPSWASNGTLTAVVGSERGIVIALIDVANPEQGKVKEVLWRRGDGLRVEPAYPVYSADTGRCVFVGREQKGQALYAVQRGKPGPPRRLEPEGFDGKIASLGFSPDGRYLLFCSDRPDRGQR
jgi:RNA polymerase sigma factor (sigma-70 family)